MKLVREARDGKHLLRVEGGLTIYEAAALRDGLLQYVRGDGIVLDLAAVDECDTAGVQVLAALARTARSRGASLAWTGVGEAVRAAVARAGLVPAEFFKTIEEE